MELSDLLELDEFDEFKFEAFKYVSDRHKTVEEEWAVFCAEINRLELVKLDVHEKLVLAQLVLSCLKDAKPGELQQFLSAAVQFKKTFGRSAYASVFSTRITGEIEVNDYLRLCYLAEETKADIDYTVYNLQKFHEWCDDKAALIKFLNEIDQNHTKEFSESYGSKDRSLAELLDSFRGKAAPAAAGAGAVSAVSATKDDSSFPLTEAELGSAGAEFALIEKEKFKLIKLSSDQLSAHIKHHSSRLKANPSSLGDRVQVLAALREQIRRQFKIFPHDTQMMALLGMINKPEALKGRMAQVKTGEGKSTIIAMLAAYLALQGRFVDVITSNRYLATRDRAKYTDFFASMGITCSDICRENPGKKDFEGQVLFATTNDLKFSILRDGLDGLARRRSFRDGKLEDRIQADVIVDEVDNLLVDNARDMALISEPSSEDQRWVYEPIYDFILKPPVPLFDEDRNLLSARETLDALRERLSAVNAGGHAEEVKALKDDRLKAWLVSACCAYLMVKDVHYIKRKTPTLVNGVYQDISTIVIVDFKVTGRLAEGSRWRDGRHQFIELKEGVPPAAESDTVASLPHSTFFRDYDNIYGLTGTMGGPCIRAELGETYHIDSFEVPAHTPSQRICSILTVCENSATHYEAVYSVLDERVKEAKQAVLILFNTIKESHEFSDFLTKVKKRPHQILNGPQPESEDSIVACAGKACAITIATNIAGRGTDIDAENLHVIFASLPANERVEDQGYGRTARQGRKGSCESILCIQDPAILELPGSVNFKGLLRFNSGLVKSKAFYNLLTKERNQVAKSQSMERTRHVALETLRNGKLKLFFLKLKEVRAQFSTPHLQEKFLNQCENFTSVVAIPNTFTLAKSWARIIFHARALLRQKSVSLLVDWKAFITEFKEIFIKEFRREWASLYNELQECSDLENPAVYIEIKYIEFERKWDEYFKLEELLSCILIKASEEAPASSLVSTVSPALFHLDRASIAAPAESGRVGVTPGLSV